MDPAELVRKSVVNDHNAFYASTVITAWFALLADSPLLFPANLKPRSVFHRFLSEILSHEFSETVRKYADMAQLLLESEQVHHPGSGDRPFLREFVDTPCFKEYHEFYKFGDKRLLRWLLSFLVFPKKGKFERPDLETAAFRGWLEVEKRLTQSLPGGDIVSDLKLIMSELLPRPNADFFYPRHGPGQVSEGIGRNADVKHPLHYLDKRSASVFESIIHPLDNRDDYARLPVKGEKVLPHATLRFVPKDNSKMRSICMEPTMRMYLQQGILHMMLHAFDSGPISRFVSIRDQGRNRSLAVKGSIHLNLDTIDLSSASDSVGWDLIKEVLPVGWVRLLAATRSTTVRHGDTVYSLRKFAPMGSALCFPTQCIVFLSVVLLAHMRYEHKMDGGFSVTHVRKTLGSLSKDPHSHRLHEPSVYGDDIICDTRVTKDVIQMLGDLRFEVNVDKSFTASQYIRESCGIYCHSGDDVTPIRFTIPFHKGVVNPKRIASFMEGANYAYKIGFTNLRRWYIRQALYMPIHGRNKVRTRVGRKEPRPGELKTAKRGTDLPIRDGFGRLRIPFVTDERQFGILCDPYRIRRNDHLDREAKPAWQREGWRSLSIDSVRKPIVNVLLHEAYSHSLYWRAKLRAEDLTSYGHASNLPEDTRFVWGWVPAQ